MYIAIGSMITTAVCWRAVAFEVVNDDIWW